MYGNRADTGAQLARELPLLESKVVQFEGSNRDEEETDGGSDVRG